MKDPIKLNNVSDYLAHIWGPPNADLSSLSIGELREVQYAGFTDAGW